MEKNETSKRITGDIAMNDHTVPQLPPSQSMHRLRRLRRGLPQKCHPYAARPGGFLYPTVTDACIQCGHCTHICPVLRQREAHPSRRSLPHGTPTMPCGRTPPAGGVFSLLADYVLEGGGVVFGAGMDAQLRVRHEAVKRRRTCPASGAKPVQSDVTGIYQQVRRELDRGRPVLFSGTPPCQVDRTLPLSGRAPEKLLTCDVLCRGVCSPGVWAKLVQSMAYHQAQAAGGRPILRQAARPAGAPLPGTVRRRHYLRLPSVQVRVRQGLFETSSCARPVTPVPMPPWTGPAICRWEYSTACPRTPTPRSARRCLPCCW